MGEQTIDNVQVSIIIPAYNAARYIRKSIMSVLNQSVREIELIIVDDGSVDNTLAICQKLSAKDPRIYVIHQENKGVSAARNVALCAAKGKYICFLDADDWMPSNALENLMSLERNNGEALLLGCIEVVASMRNWKISCGDHDVSISQSAEWAQFIFDYKSSLGYIGGKLFCNEIIRNHHLRFQEDMHFSEDACFIYHYLQYCRSVQSSSEIVYEYNRMNELAATSQYHSDQVDNKLKLLAEQFRLLDHVNKTDEVMQYAANGLLWQIKDIAAYHVYYHPMGSNKELTIQACELLCDFINRQNICIDSVFQKDLVGRLFIRHDYEAIYHHFCEIKTRSEEKTNPVKLVLRKLYATLRRMYIMHSI